MQTNAINENDYEPLIGFESRYKIQKEYPFDIYDIKYKTFIIGIMTERDGNRLCLFDENDNPKRVLKHHLIARHFMPGYRPGCLVLHKNHIMTDNRLENLTYHRSEVQK